MIKCAFPRQKNRSHPKEHRFDNDCMENEVFCEDNFNRYMSSHDKPRFVQGLCDEYKTKIIFYECVDEESVTYKPINEERILQLIQRRFTTKKNARNSYARRLSLLQSMNDRNTASLTSTSSVVSKDSITYAQNTKEQNSKTNDQDIIADNNDKDHVEKPIAQHHAKKDELIPPLLPPVVKWSKQRKIDPNNTDFLPLPFKGYDLAPFTKEQISSLPIKFSHTSDNITSIHRMKVAQHNYLAKKMKRYLQKPTKPLLDEDNEAPKSKKLKRNETIYIGPAPLCPPGWKLIEKRRLTGTGRGRIDRRWRSPQTGKRFQSSVEVRVFLDCLDCVDGNEDKAYLEFKQRK